MSFAFLKGIPTNRIQIHISYLLPGNPRELVGGYSLCPLVVTLGSYTPKLNPCARKVWGIIWGASAK